MPKLTGNQMRSNWTGTAPACHGCGVLLARVEAGDAEHRPDCTVEPSPLFCSFEDCDAMRLPSEAREALAKNRLWQFLPHPLPGRYLCPDHHQKRGTTP